MLRQVRGLESATVTLRTIVRGMRDHEDRIVKAIDAEVELASLLIADLAVVRRSFCLCFI